MYIAVGVTCLRGVKRIMDRIPATGVDVLAGPNPVVLGEVAAVICCMSVYPSLIHDRILRTFLQVGVSQRELTAPNDHVVTAPGGN